MKVFPDYRPLVRPLGVVMAGRSVRQPAWFALVEHDAHDVLLVLVQVGHPQQPDGQTTRIPSVLADRA
jgi:hypothetical protein